MCKYNDVIMYKYTITSSRTNIPKVIIAKITKNINTKNKKTKKKESCAVDELTCPLSHFTRSYTYIMMTTKRTSPTSKTKKPHKNITTAEIAKVITNITTPNFEIRV